MGQFLSYRGLFIRVEAYALLEPRIGTAIAELELSVDVSSSLDPDDDRGTTLSVHGCLLHQHRGEFWVTLPEGTVSLPYPEEHPLFESSVFKDLVKSFPEVIPPALFQVTEELRQKEEGELSV
jgi:hypothetical protein